MVIVIMVVVMVVVVVVMITMTAAVKNPKRVPQYTSHVSTVLRLVTLTTKIYQLSSSS
jgi:autonomous glycyl radical cofactor GrcA